MNNKDYRPFSASIYTFLNDFEDNNPEFGIVPIHVRFLAVYLCTAPERHKSGLINISVRSISDNTGIDRRLIFETLEQLAQIPYDSQSRDYNGGFLILEQGKVFVPFIADLTLQGKENKWLYKNIYQPIEDKEISDVTTPRIFDAYCKIWNEEIYLYQSLQQGTVKKQTTTISNPIEVVTVQTTTTLRQYLEAEEARLRNSGSQSNDVSSTRINTTESEDVQHTEENVTTNIPPTLEPDFHNRATNNGNVIEYQEPDNTQSSRYNTPIIAQDKPPPEPITLRLVPT